MSPDATTLIGDCAEVLKQIPGDSVHCCITSPPYDKLRTYGGQSQWNLAEVAAQIFRVLEPGGILCWNVGDSVVKGGETLSSFRQAIHFVDVAGFRMHDTMIWHKLNFAHPEKVRYHQVFEYVFVLTKGKPRTFNPIKDKRNATAGRIGCLGKNTYAKRDGSRSTRATYVTKTLGQRGNVWTGKTRGQEEFCKNLPHPAMMPKWLARDLIASWSNPGDTILDPFAGSGTTGRQALELGRKFIGIDLNPDCIELIRRFTHNLTPGLAIK